MQKINYPLTEKQIKSLKSGDEVWLSGAIYTARDQAHKRLCQLIKKSQKLPLDLRNAAVYYCGPTKTPKGRPIGSCGPTTSSRMDKFTPLLLKSGLRVMIGKGARSKEVVQAIKKYKGVYFITLAGCGALLAGKVRKAKPLAFKDLGPEAIYRLEVKDFPLIVAVDSRGNSIYR
jgi:fumarate hydratase subunit beta